MNNFTKTKNNRFEINIKDVQFNVFYLAKQLNTYFYLNSYATIEYLDCLCFSNMFLFEIRKQQSIKKDKNNKRLLAKVDFVDAIIISIFVFEQS